ncbi:dTDP-4-dehydrorhamnose reductase [Patescibacteria group bacterium]
MKVLIIGANGTLGGALRTEFSDEDVMSWDKDEIDIIDKDQVNNKIRIVSPDLIINSAAYNDVDGCESNFEIANAVNGYAVGYLAEISEELNIPIIQYSTGYVFGGEKNEGYNEEDNPEPISKYGASKLLGEKELQIKTDKFYLIRTNLLFGDGGAGNSKKSFIDLMLGLAEQKDELQVVDNEISNPTYVKDLAKATFELVNKKYPFGIYHLVNEGKATWYDWAVEIFRIKNIDITVKPVNSNIFSRPAKRPKNSSLLNTKFPKFRSWEDALREYLI